MCIGWPICTFCTSSPPWNTKIFDICWPKTDVGPTRKTWTTNQQCSWYLLWKKSSYELCLLHSWQEVWQKRICPKSCFKSSSVWSNTAFEGGCSIVQSYLVSNTFPGQPLKKNNVILIPIVNQPYKWNKWVSNWPRGLNSKEQPFLLLFFVQ